MPFSPRSEAVLFGMPVLFLAVSLPFVARGLAVPTGSEALIYALAYTVGLQKAHNFFTYPLVVLPEFRRWRREQLESQRRDFYLRWILTASVVILLFGTCSYIEYGRDAARLDRPFWGPWTPRAAVNFGFWGLNYWHVFSQFFGLSMLYNAGASLLDDAELARFRRVNRLERIAFRAFIAAGSFGLAFAYSVGLPPPQQKLFVLAMAVLAALNVGICLQYHPSIRRKKLLVNLRLWLVPLFTFSVVVRWSLGLLHNFEYAVITKTIAGNSARPARFYLWAGGAILLFVLLGCLVEQMYFAPYAVFAFHKAHPGFRAVGWTIVISLTTLHYILDGHLFRFSDPVTRKHIRPLFGVNAP